MKARLPAYRALIFPVILPAIALAWILLLPTPASAGIEEGYDAFGRGDVEGAVQIWRSLAEQGNTTAQFNLGQIYRLGNGVKADDREALKWYLLAAKGGLVSAQYNLILMYEEGRISSKDIAPLLAAADGRLEQLPPDDYLLQIIATPNRDALNQYVKANKVAFQQQQLLAVIIRRDDKDWHTLFLGPFSDKEGARQARSALPKALRKDNPWIRTVAAVQAAAINHPP